MVNIHLQTGKSASALTSDLSNKSKHRLEFRETECQTVAEPDGGIKPLNCFVSLQQFKNAELNMPCFWKLGSEIEVSAETQKQKQNLVILFMT